MQSVKLIKVTGTIFLVLQSYPNYPSPLLASLVTRPFTKNIIFLFIIQSNICYPDNIYFYMTAYKCFVINLNLLGVFVAVMCMSPFYLYKNMT